MKGLIVGALMLFATPAGAQVLVTKTEPILCESFLTAQAILRLLEKGQAKVAIDFGAANSCWTADAGKEYVLMATRGDLILVAEPTGLASRAWTLAGWFKEKE